MQHNSTYQAPNSPKLFRLFWVGCFLIINSFMAYSNNSLNLNVTVDTGDANCGQTNGIASATVSGGAPPYTYLWSNGETTQIIQNLAPGTYTVTVTDNLGAQASATGTVGEINTLTVAIPSPPFTTCVGSCDADIAAFANGGTPPYTYSWNTGQDTFFLDNVCEGIYSVTVTDANGCTAEASGEVELSPEGVWIMTVPDPVNCFGGDDGQAEAKPMTGEPPYTYVWSDGQMTKVATGLVAGKYFVTVTDANGCTNRDSTIVTQPDQINVTTTPSPTACGQSTGSITTNVSGGTPPYTYSWSNGGNTSTINNLSAGTYALTLTDANGCESIIPNQIITENCFCVPPVIESVVVYEATCGQSDGRAYVNVAGGFFNYNFAWSSNVSTEFFATGLAVGTYTVTISDRNDPTCNTVETFTVGAKDGPDVEVVQVTPATCNEANGTATLSPIGLIYEWCNGETGNNAVNLPAGECYVMVTDTVSGCIDFIQVDIPEINPLTATPTVNAKPDCDAANGNGSVTIDVSGGSGSYEFAWSDGGLSSASRNDLSPGIYAVTVTDLGPTGCTTVANFILGATGVDATVTVDPVVFTSCVGENDGMVTINVVPGPGFALPATTQIVDANNIVYTNGQLAPGNYCVLVTDANGCPADGPCFEVKAPEQIDVDLAVFNKTCTNNGDIGVVSVTGGNGNYVFDWADIPGTDNPRDRPGILAGTYTLTVSDVNGCSVVISDIVVGDECLCIPPVIESLVIIESDCGGAAGSAVVNVFDNGRTTYEYSWTGMISTGRSATGLPAGIYTVTISDTRDSLCSLVETFTVGNSDGPKVDKTVTPATCQASDGQVTFSPDSLTYEWSNGFNGATQNNLPAGKYFVTITDPTEPNCPNIVTVDVGTVSALGVEEVIVQLPDCQQSNGAVDIQVVGGAGNYIYEWSDGNTNGSRSDLSSGIYRVTVSEMGGNDCESVVEFLLEDNVSAMGTIDIDPIVRTSCPGVDDGLVNLTSLNFGPGFVFPPNIKITDANNNTYVNGLLGPGDYCMVIRDGNGCIAGGDCFKVEGPEQIDLDLAVLDDGCLIKGAILITELSGGNGGFTFDWLDIVGSPDTISNRFRLDSGDYSLIVTDAKNCSVSVDVKVEENKDADADFTVSYDNCDSGSISVQFNGSARINLGTDWEWRFSNGDSSFVRNPIVEIDTVTVLDVTLIVETRTGCLDTVMRQLNIEPIIENISDTVISCNGAPVELNPSGDTSYVYTWSPGLGLDDPNAANPIANPDSNTMYTVMITNLGGSDTCSIVKEVMIEVVTVDTSAVPAFGTRQCDDLTVDFTVGGIDASLYSWNFGDPNDPNASASGDTVAHTYSQSGIYTVTLSPLPSATCLTKEFELVLEVFDSPLFEPDFDLNYIECSDTAVIQLSDSSNHSLYDINAWQWTFGNQMGSSTDQNPTISIGQDGDLTIRLLVTTTNGCMDSIEQTISINVINLDLQDSLTACPGDTVFLNPDADPTQNYAWTPSSMVSDSAIANPFIVATSGTNVFEVVASDDAGLCTLTEMITVIAGSDFSDFALSQTDTVTCGDVPVSLGVSASGATSFEWSTDRDFNVIVGQSDQLDVMSGVRGDSILYYIRLTDDLGCNIIDSVEVSNKAVVYEIEQDDVKVCKGDSAVLNVTFALNVGDDVNTEWVPGGIIVDNSDPNFPIIKPEQSGMLILMATNQYGCTSMDSVNIEVIDLGDGLLATADPTEIYKGGKPSQLNVNAPPDSTTVLWTPFDGLNRDDIVDPQASPEETTEYTVEVMDEDGLCAVTRTVTVTVVDAPCGEPFIFLPNAFTPNDDNRNDILYLRGINVSEMWLIIYNRWGEKVFETRDQDTGWDGTFKGRKLSSDVYGYYLRVICEDGNEFVKKGNISLLK